jgi:DNA-binding NarL/FixJ family response regulator
MHPGSQTHEKAAAVSSSGGSAPSIRVFIVDDHPLVRDGLGLRLGALPGIALVGEAASATEVLAKIEAARPDLLLSDIGLPDMSGIELTTRLRARMPALRIVMLSMHESPETVQQAMQAGAHGYVPKAAPATDIEAAVRAVAAGGSFISAALARRLFHRRAPRPCLTPRESEILSALGRGDSSKRIASDLALSVRTVEAHRQSIKRRLGIEGQAGLIKYAVEQAGKFRAP